jgi:DNA-binding CsgD family transcriptional regulator
VQYDSRGQGMSTHGLPESHSIHAYVRDLEAVVERLDLNGFALYGGPLFCHVAVHYAARHAERLKAFILGDVGPDVAMATTGLEELARRDWDLFLHTMASAFSLEGAPREFAYWRQSLDQDDCLKMFRAGHRSSIRKLLPSVATPTLVLNTRRMSRDAPPSALADAGRTIAALMPNARLILFDGFASYWYSAGPEPPPAVLAIAGFLEDLEQCDEGAAAWPSNRTSGQARATALSAREIEVLRLVAQGKTNREIAGELVISERTVINHLSHIFIKTGAENRAGATAYAIRHGLA